MYRLVLGCVIAATGAVLSGCSGPQSHLSGEVANDPALISKGEYIAAAGDCAACHTSKDGQPFAGGLRMQAPMLGGIYTSNISPDKATGIGNWSLHDFDNALRFGVARDGSNLYPAMPYVSYSKMSDDDVRALYAYLKYQVAAVQRQATANDIPWLLSARWPLKIWNGLFAPTTPYQPVAVKSAEWNRGAYLVQGLAHCGSCHTPRGLFLQEKALSGDKAGYLSGASLAGWHAFNITPDAKSGIGGWSVADLQQYLSTGNLPSHAQAAGPMSEAIEHGLARLSDTDIKAIASYVKTVPAVDHGFSRSRDSWGQPLQGLAVKRGVALSTLTQPQDIFLAACAKCHKPTGLGSEDQLYPSLVHNSTIGSTDSTNLTQVILHGIHRGAIRNMDEVEMPAFDEKLNDQQIASLVNYLSQQFGNPETPQTSADTVKQLRDQQ